MKARGSRAFTGDAGSAPRHSDLPGDATTICYRPPLPLRRSTEMPLSLSVCQTEEAQQLGPTTATNAALDGQLVESNHEALREM
jgi:hypothetical protein